MVKKILSIDGGGCRGVLTLKALDIIEKKYKIKIAEYFDMFAGTSTGALIATLFAHNKMTAEEILNIVYTRENIKTIFNKSYLDKILGIIQFAPKYTNDAKLKFIKQYLQLNEDDKNEYTLRDVDKPILIVAYNPQKKIPVFFRNYTNSVNYKLSEVCNASSAAPSYFPAVSVTNFVTKKSSMLIDGGVCANNPCMIAYMDAKQIYPDEQIKILSVGTGIVKSTIEPYTQFGGIKWAMGDNNIINLILDANQVIADIVCKKTVMENEDVYIRANNYLTVASDEIDDSSLENYNNLLKEGKLLWENNVQKFNEFFN